MELQIDNAIRVIFGALTLQRPIKENGHENSIFRQMSQI
jgi:hypothetical protein